jgi:hypothetical protein
LLPPLSQSPNKSQSYGAMTPGPGVRWPRGASQNIATKTTDSQSSPPTLRSGCNLNVCIYCIAYCLVLGIVNNTLWDPSTISFIQD